MFKKILYPTDFSDVSWKSLDYIKQLKECGSEEVVVLHVINQDSIQAVRIYAAGKISVEEFVRELAEDARKSLLEIQEAGIGH